MFSKFTCGIWTDETAKSNSRDCDMVVAQRIETCFVASSFAEEISRLISAATATSRPKCNFDLWDVKAITAGFV